MCPPTWAHWRHLANTIELALPSAHPNPQPKRQIDRFSRFSTAHGRVSSSTVAPDDCAHWRHLANIIDLVLHSAHPSRQPKRHLERFSRFCTTDGIKSSFFLQWSTLFPKTAPFHGDLGPHLIHDSLGQSKPTIRTASRSVQLFSNM